MENQSRCTYGKSALSSSFPGAGFNVCVDYECCVSGTLLALSDLTRSPLSTTEEELYVTAAAASCVSLSFYVVPTLAGDHNCL